MAKAKFLTGKTEIRVKEGEIEGKGEIGWIAWQRVFHPFSFVHVHIHTPAL